MVRMVSIATDALGRHWRSAGLVVVFLLGIATPRVVQLHWSATALLAAGLVMALAWWARPTDRPSRWLAPVCVGAILVFTATAILPGADADYWDSFSASMRLLWGGVALVLAALPMARRREFQLWAGVVMIAAVSIAGLVHISYMSGLSTDVIAGHRVAADVLAEGRNPYADAVFPDSGPRYANVGDIVGYAYPPATMIPYVASEWLGEARWVSVLAMAAVMGMVLWFGSREPRAGLLLLGVAITFPMLGAMYAHGWTEPLSLVFVFAGILAGLGRVRGGVLTGLAIVSKQYMVLALVPLLTMRRLPRVRLMLVVGVTGLVVTVPFLIWDPAAFWHALVGFQFDRVARTDVLSIGAFGIRLPIALALIASVAFGLAVGRRVQGGWHIVLAQAATMAVYFAVSTNSFRNYWFMVAMLVLGSVAISVGQRPTIGADDQPATPVRTAAIT